METFTPNPQDTQRKMTPHTDHNIQPAVTDAEVRAAIVTILRSIGEDPEREGIKETPDRIMRMMKELFAGYDPQKKPTITTFSNDSHTTEMVFDSGDYYSMCEHHMLPFFGQYYFAYIPCQDGRILGISKIARVIGYCAARLQLQERLARDVVEMLSDALDGKAQGFAIVLKGMHMCKTMRGVKNKGNMCVSHFTGCFERDAQLRNEFYQMLSMN